MKLNHLFFALVAVHFCVPHASAKTLLTESDLKTVESIVGWKGKLSSTENVFKISKPRTDRAVKIGSGQVSPFAGLTSWVSFTAGKKKTAMIMGDLVLFQDEVNPVIDALFANGINVTAIHNHFFYEEPHVYFMHVSAEGNIENLAKGIKAATDKQTANESLSEKFFFDFPSKHSISAEPLNKILGVTGEIKDGMYKAVFGRKTKMDCGCDVGKDMGVNTWAAFAGTDSSATVDGDFAVTEGELQPVLRSLRKSNIAIVAIHSHMSGETPRILFLHYWGRGHSQDLANGLKTALLLQKGQN